MSAAAPVVIEMPAQDAALPYARILVNACTEGLRDKRPCALEDSPGEAAYAVVILSWEGSAHTAANIEVGVRRGSRADWVTRHVTFNASDVEVERWRSVGLIVATLVEQVGGEKKAEGTQPAQSAQPAPTPATGAGPKPTPQERSGEAGRTETEGETVFESPSTATTWGGGAGAWLIDGAFEMAHGTGSGLGALGGVARVSRQVGPLPLSVTGSLRYETQASDTPRARITMQWVWVTAGVAVAKDFVGAPLRVEARMEPTLGWVQATATGAGSSPSGALLGLREGVAATWWWVRPIGLVVGAEALESTRSAEVGVSPTGGPPYQTVITEDWLAWSVTAGVRLRLE
jgi:hypothetical protein